MSLRVTEMFSCNIEIKGLIPHFPRNNSGVFSFSDITELQILKCLFSIWDIGEMKC